MADKSAFERNVHGFRELVAQKGWIIVSESEIQSGYEFRVTDGKHKVPIRFYTTGKALIQGKNDSLRSQIEVWWQNQSSFSSTSTKDYPISGSQPQIRGVARIGLDESGKGDYFGPLVIGAVYVDETTEEKLLHIGARDSKQLKDTRILELAEKIKLLCPNSIVPIGPKRYNELYDEIKNLNILLAWGHARALENVLGIVNCDLAVADQFGDESFLLNALLKKGRQIKLEQRPKAEQDVAVAAASILARAEFVKRIEQLSRRLGNALPKGSSDPTIVTIGRDIVRNKGKSTLAEVAKLHFKTTQAIMK